MNEIEGELIIGARLWDRATAKEALEYYAMHNKFIRVGGDSEKKGRYSIFDGRDKQITIADLKSAAKKEIGCLSDDL